MCFVKIILKWKIKIKNNKIVWFLLKGFIINYNKIFIFVSMFFDMNLKNRYKIYKIYCMNIFVML